MKKIKTVFLCLCLIFVFVGCGNGDVRDGANDSHSDTPISLVGNPTSEKDVLYAEKKGETAVDKGSVYGVKFRSAGGFSGAEVSGYSKSGKEVAVELKLYRWNESRERTVSQHPVAEGHVYLLSQKTSNYFSFGSNGIVDGEYFLTVTALSDGAVLDSGTQMSDVEYYKDGSYCDFALCIGISKMTE